MTNVGSGSLAPRPRPARSIQTLSSPAPAAPPMSQRRLSPTKTTSDLGTWMTLSACSKSLRDGLTLRLSDENTVVAKRFSTPARANSLSHRSLREMMLAITPRRWVAARRLSARAYVSGTVPSSWSAMTRSRNYSSLSGRLRVVGRSRSVSNTPGKESQRAESS